MRSVFTVILLAACAAFFLGCDVLRGALSSARHETIGVPSEHKAEMLVLLEGKTFEGMITTHVRDSIPFSMQSSAKMNRVEVHTCARHHVF